MERTVTSPRTEPAVPAFAVGTRRAIRRPWWRVAVPWTVYRYLLGEVLRVFALAIVAVGLLYSVVATYQIVRSGLQISFAWPLLTKTFAYPLYYSIPISLLFAVTLTVGRLSSDLEIAALRTHGVSHAQLFAPILALGLVLSGVSGYINGWIVPEIHYKKRNLQAYILEQLESLGSGQHRTLLLPDGVGTLWVGSYSGTDLREVQIDLHVQGNSHLLPELKERFLSQLPSKVKVFAREGSLELTGDRSAVLLNLRGVDVLVPEGVRTMNVTKDRFIQRFSISENVVIPLSFAPKSPGIKDRIQPELSAYVEELRGELRRERLYAAQNLARAAHSEDRAGSPAAEQRTRRLEHRVAVARTEYHRRLSFSLACLTFPFVGMALTLLVGTYTRLVPFLLSNLLVIGIYYPLLMVGVAVGERGILPPVAMALPNVATLALGIYLARKVCRQ